MFRAEGLQLGLRVQGLRGVGLRIYRLRAFGLEFRVYRSYCLGPTRIRD